SATRRADARRSAVSGRSAQCPGSDFHAAAPVPPAGEGHLHVWDRRSGSVRKKLRLPPGDPGYATASLARTLRAALARSVVHPIQANLALRQTCGSGSVRRRRLDLLSHELVAILLHDILHGNAANTRDGFLLRQTRPDSLALISL